MTTLIRRNPYDPIYDIDLTMRQMMDRMRAMMTTVFTPLGDHLLIPEAAEPLGVDVSSDGDHVIVRTALPGFTDDEIHVNVQGNVLRITAESRHQHVDSGPSWYFRKLRYGKVSRSVVLPDEVAANAANATLEKALVNGVLTVKVPKRTRNPFQKIAVKVRNLLKPGSKRAG